MRKIIKNKYTILIYVFSLILTGALIKNDESFKDYEVVSYSVSSGDTLWDLAKKYYDGDPRVWVREVSELNRGSGAIYANTTIKILVKKGE